MVWTQQRSSSVQSWARGLVLLIADGHGDGKRRTVESLAKHVLDFASPASYSSYSVYIVTTRPNIFIGPTDYVPGWPAINTCPNS